MNRDAASAAFVGAADRAARLHVLLRVVECAATGSLGAAVVFAAGLASGARAEAALIVVCVAIGAFTAVSTWSGRPPRAGDVARRADRAAGLDGALTTLVERARGAEASELDGLLARRVAAVLRPRDVIRAAVPRTPLALAAPLLAATLIVYALDRRGSVATRIEGASAGLRAAAERSRADGDAAAADALELAARRLEASDAETGARDASAVSARTAALADLERAARTLPAGSTARREIESALADLAARAAPTPATAAGREGPSSGRGRSAGSTADGATRVASGSGGAASRSGTLANGSDDGRMLGPLAGGESDPQSGDPVRGASATGGAARGVLSARWWPSRYDAVVERYLAP